MKDTERFKLLYGPYLPPVVKRGDLLVCAVRGSVRCGGYSDKPIMWPRVLKTGQLCLIVCGDLERAVRCESELAIAHHWGVSITTVWTWRKALGVHRITAGTARLYEDYAPEKVQRADVLEKSIPLRDAPQARAKRLKWLTGRVMHPNTAAALLKAVSKPKSEEWKRALGERNRERARLRKAKQQEPHEQSKGRVEG